MGPAKGIGRAALQRDREQRNRVCPGRTLFAPRASEAVLEVVLLEVGGVM